MMISLEYRKVKGKYLLIKFIFDSNNDGRDHGLVCYSVDKYMSLDVWMKLYEKLAKTVERYVKSESKMPSKETIAMTHAQLDLHVSWKQTDAVHSSLSDTTADNIYPYFMVVDVRTVSRVNDFVKKQTKSKSRGNGHTDAMEQESLPPSTTATCSGINVDNSDTNIAIKRPHEEYVPTTTSPKPSALSYTPSKNVETKADEYTPTKMIVVDATADKRNAFGADVDHHYFPSPINNNNYTEYTESKPYSRGQIKSPRPNKLRASATLKAPGHKRLKSAESMSSDKTNLSQDLFGDSSESDAEIKALDAPAMSTRGNPERKAKLAAQKCIGPNALASSSTSSASLASTSSAFAKASSSNAKTSSTSANTNHPAKRLKTKGKTVDKADEKTKATKDEREREEINKIIRKKIASNTLTDLSGNDIGLTRLIDLKDMTNEEVQNTFDEFAVTIKRIFEERKWESRTKLCPDFCYATLCPILLREKQMGAMINTLTDKLTNLEEHGPTPFHNLFWECMLPEWALLIFMNRYNLTRVEALDQVRKHDIAHTLNTSYNFDCI